MFWKQILIFLNKCFFWEPGSRCEYQGAIGGKSEEDNCFGKKKYSFFLVNVFFLEPDTECECQVADDGKREKEKGKK